MVFPYRAVAAAASPLFRRGRRSSHPLAVRTSLRQNPCVSSNSAAGVEKVSVAAGEGMRKWSWQRCSPSWPCGMQHVRSHWTVQPLREHWTYASHISGQSHAEDWAEECSRWTTAALACSRWKVECRDMSYSSPGDG